jgi:hypothetical protein
MADLPDVNDLKTKLGGALSLILALGFSGCFFHHHKSSNSDMDSGDDQQAQPQPQAETAAHGAHKMSRSRASDISEMTHNPNRHIGQFVSTYGPVRSITVKPDGSTEFTISTPNYAYFFIVTFPGEIPNLEQNKDTYFLGTVRGTRTLGEVEALVVDGIAIQTTGGRGLNPYAWPKAVYVPGQEQAVSAWLNGDLDLRDTSSAHSYTAMAPAPAPAPNYYQPAPATPTYASAPTYAAPAPAYAPPAPAYRGGNTGSLDSASLVKVVQNWNQLPPEAKERILGIVSEYSR